MNQTTNEQKLRKRKVLLLLPLMVIPFLALAFLALGGGKREQISNNQQPGLNADLPDAQLPDDDAMTKMGFYDQEEQNGNKKTSEKNRDVELDTADNRSIEERVYPGTTRMPDDVNIPYDYNTYSNRSQSGGNTISSNHSSEEQIRQKLQQLQKQMNEAESNGNNSSLSDEGYSNSSIQTTEGSSEINTLRNMRKNSRQEEAGDPEIGQLQEMMDRIYDIQHPELVNERTKEKSIINRGTVFPVSSAPEMDNITLLRMQNLKDDSVKNNRGLQSQNGFFGLDEGELTGVQTDAGIMAIVQENSTIVNGSTVKLRLLQDVYINGQLIPTGNFINGTASLSNERISIEIKSVLYQANLFQVNLTAYDMDGMEGIYVPGSIRKEVIRQSGDNALQSIGMGTIDPSIGAQATAAGIETAKSLLSKKVKQIKVFVKAGHHIMLKDNNNSNH